jgi:hypothetical protein
MNLENEKLREKVYQITSALQIVVEKAKLKSNSKPKNAFTSKNEEFTGNFCLYDHM